MGSRRTAPARRRRDRPASAPRCRRRRADPRSTRRCGRSRRARSRRRSRAPGRTGSRARRCVRPRAPRPHRALRLIPSHSARFSSERRRYSSTSIRYRSTWSSWCRNHGHVFGAVLGGLGREVPEPPEQLDAHPTPETLGVGLDDLAQPRIQVLAGLAVPEHVDEALVVEAGGPELDPLQRHADRPREERVRIADAVADADDRSRRAGATRSRCPRAPSPSGSCS